MKPTLSTLLFSSITRYNKGINNSSTKSDKPSYIHLETFSDTSLHHLSKFRFYKENIKYRNINIKHNSLLL